MTDFLARARTMLEAARLLARSDHRESAANRAYYAMFHAMQAVLLARGLPAREVKSHSGLKRLFDQHLVRSGLVSRDVSAAIQRASEMRWLADYGDDLPTATIPVETAIADAARLIEICAGLIGETPE